MLLLLQYPTVATSKRFGEGEEVPSALQQPYLPLEKLVDLTIWHQNPLSQRPSEVKDGLKYEFVTKL